MPESPEGSVEAVHNAEELAANDTDWNSYLKIVTFTCPEGSVMEFPNEVNHHLLFCVFISYQILNFSDNRTNHS